MNAPRGYNYPTSHSQSVTNITTAEKIFASASNAPSVRARAFRLPRHWRA